jgi:hypothetical protein
VLDVSDAEFIELMEGRSIGMRAHLTRAVLALRDEGQLDELSAAAAAYELASRTAFPPIAELRTRIGGPRARVRSSLSALGR